MDSQRRACCHSTTDPSADQATRYSEVAVRPLIQIYGMAEDLRLGIPPVNTYDNNDLDVTIC